MARQCGNVLFYGTFFWANGYIGPDGKGVMRMKPPGVTRKELKYGKKSALRRVWTSRFADVSRTVMDCWRWTPKEIRALADRYAAHKIVGMLMPSKRGAGLSIASLSGMNLSGPSVLDSGIWIDVIGEDRDFYERACRLPQGFTLRGVDGMTALFPKVKKDKLRARVLIHVGQADGPQPGRLHHQQVTEWMELSEVAAFGKMKLDWKKILQGKNEGDIVVTLALELGYLRGKGVVRLKTGCRVWIAWAGALEDVPKRRANKGLRRQRVPDRKPARSKAAPKKPAIAANRDGP